MKPFSNFSIISEAASDVKLQATRTSIGRFAVAPPPPPPPIPGIPGIPAGL
jgi:hypothetical protein